jgi:thymidylate synthase
MVGRNGACKSCIDVPGIKFTETPLVTVRKTAWKAVKEMAWFMGGSELCPTHLLSWWQSQLNPLGYYRDGYSKQLRSFGGDFDQIAFMLDGLRNHQDSRRLVLTTWNPREMSLITTTNQNPKTPTTCFPSWVNVLTEAGIRTIQDINPGDKIWDGSKYVTVTSKVSKGVQQVYKVTTRKGSLFLTKDHKIHNGKVLLPVSCAKRIQLNLGKVDEMTSALVPEHIMDGLVVADGVSNNHKTRSKHMQLHIGVNDQDYFVSEVAHLILRQSAPTHNPSQYLVKTSITELPITYEREVPNKYFFGTPIEKRGFLRGYFSGNGSSNDNATTLIASSKKLVEQIQIMLSSLGVASSISVRPSTTVVWENGVYLSREGYQLSVLRQHRQLFYDLVGFIQKYKQCRNVAVGSKITTTAKIQDFSFYAMEEVFDITVDSPEHVFWCNGFTISNCHSTLVQFFVRFGTLYMTSYQRSADLLLGVPHNWLQSWALLLWFAHHSNLDVGHLLWLFGDAHIYQEPSHLDTIEAIKSVLPYYKLYEKNPFKMVYNFGGGYDDKNTPIFRAEDFTLEGTVPPPRVTNKPILLT